MFKNTKLSTRLAMGFSIILVLLAIIVGVVIVSLTGIQTSMYDIVDVNVYELNLYEDMTKCVYEIIGDMKEMVMIDNPAKVEEINKEITDLRAAYDAKSKEIEKIASSEAGAAQQEKIKEELSKARPLNNKVIELIKANNREEAAKVYENEADPVDDAWLAAMKEAIDMQNESNTKEAANATAENQRTILIVIILGSVTIIAGIVIAVFITRSITKPVKNIVIDLTEGAQQVAAASGQLSATSQQLAEGNSEQASSIEETSSTLEESASMVSQNSENTRQAAILAAQTKASSDKGNNDMHDMMNSMNEIKKSSDQIAKIIKVIDDIAFQTNMLALNAAVEAARAGDAGMGFAVVAEEVRNLAQRSAQAAKDTAAIIESNITLSENGVSVAKKVGESLAEITVQAKKVNELMDEIAAASQEQSQGISQINKAISQMEAVTQQNAANAEESASASEELNAQAGNLREIVQQLVILVDGKAAETYTHASVNNSKPSPKSGGFNSASALKPAGTGISNLRASNRLAEASRDSKKTYVVDPEDVIPLNENTGEF
jgi:methyl-accepting chemotaxis protein